MSEILNANDVPGLEERIKHSIQKWKDARDKRRSWISKALGGRIRNFEFDVISALGMAMSRVPFSASHLEAFLIESNSKAEKNEVSRLALLQGYVLSAAYISEARKHLNNGMENAASVSLETANFYLGTVSIPISASDAASTAANAKHFPTAVLLENVIDAAGSLERNLRNKKIGYAKATRKVAEMLATNHKEVLFAYHQAHHGKTDVPELSLLTQALASQLINWIRNPEHHPEVRVAFLPFKERRGRPPRDK